MALRTVSGDTILKNKKLHNALPSDHRLNGYVVQSILGQSGSGITYLARDTKLQKMLAIKEFFPAQLATRGDDGCIQAASEDATAAYHRGLTSFIANARTLAQFRHPNIPHVYAVLELNNTAYRVMENESGHSLQDVLNEGGLTGQENILDLLMPLLDGVEHIHQVGLVHGGIGPERIILRVSGPPVLLGFGSNRPGPATGAQQSTSEPARKTVPFEQSVPTIPTENTPRHGPSTDIYALGAAYYRAALGGADRWSTAFLESVDKALIEEYIAAGKGSKEGPWSDIYALAASFYPAVAGRTTSAALSRARAFVAGLPDPLKPVIGLEGNSCSRPFLAAMDKALRFLPEERPQSIAAWRIMLNSDEEIIEIETKHPPAKPTKPSPPASAADSPQPSTAEVTAADKKAASGRAPPPRQEAGFAAKQALANARAAADKAAKERALAEAQAAARARRIRRWLGIGTLIAALVALAITVGPRLLHRTDEPRAGSAPENVRAAASSAPGETSEDRQPRVAIQASAPVSALNIAALLPLLNSANCISAAATIDNGVVHLTGYSARASATAGLIQAVETRADGRVQNGITELSADKCGPLEAYRPAWRSNQGSLSAAKLSTKNPGNVFTAGERLVIHLKTPAYPSYLYVDFFTLDGTVYHMLPNVLNSDNQAPAHYQATIGDLGDWVAAPPFGQELVVMLSSSLPLFRANRPERENAESYLAALSRELRRASNTGNAQLAASYLLLTTQPEQ